MSHTITLGDQNFGTCTSHEQNICFVKHRNIHFFHSFFFNTNKLENTHEFEVYYLLELCKQCRKILLIHQKFLFLPSNNCNGSSLIQQLPFNKAFCVVKATTDPNHPMYYGTGGCRTYRV